MKELRRPAAEAIGIVHTGGNMTNQSTAYTPYLDGTTQETFNKSFDQLLEWLREDSERISKFMRVRCLKCGHVQPSSNWYNCQKCGHDTGELIL